MKEKTGLFAIHGGRFDLYSLDNISTMLEFFYLKKLCLFTFSVAKALIFWEEVYNLHANSTALASVSILGDAPHVGE